MVQRLFRCEGECAIEQSVQNHPCRPGVCHPTVICCLLAICKNLRTSLVATPVLSTVHSSSHSAHDRELQWDCLTSGHMYSGVPHVVLHALCRLYAFENPKSHSFTVGYGQHPWSMILSSCATNPLQRSAQGLEICWQPECSCRTWDLGPCAAAKLGLAKAVASPALLQLHRCSGQETPRQ